MKGSCNCVKNSNHAEFQRIDRNEIRLIALPFVRYPRPRVSPAVNLPAVEFKCGRADSLRTADAFPVVASLRGREATTGNASAVRRLSR